MGRRNIHYELIGSILLPLSLAACSQEPATDDVGGHYNIETANDLRQTGFGVTAYTTGETYYAAGQTKYLPNFMYNQRVTYDPTSSSWSYAPLVYWPEGKTSFFAYAPYQQDASERLTAMNGSNSFPGGNSYKGDPTVTYSVAGDPTKSVDLLWATNTEGLPWLNQVKPTVSSRLTFYFRHALAKVNLQAEYVLEKGTEEDSKAATNTLVLIDSIYVEGDGSLPSTATLSLDNTTASTPLWSQPSGKVKVAIGASALNSLYASTSVTNDDSFKKVKEGGGGLPMILNGEADKATDILTSMSTPAGNATTAALMLIPSSATSSTTATVRVTVVYTLVSYDENLIYNKPQYIGLHALRFQVDADNWQEPVGFSPAVYPWTTGDGSDEDLTIDKNN